MNPYPSRNSVILWDNNAPHRNAEVRALCAQKGVLSFSPILPFSLLSLQSKLTFLHLVGVRLLYTPPYDPRFQPCELIFGAAKSRLRSMPHLWHHQQGPFYAIQALLMSQVPDETTAAGFFRHCGLK
jgi:transposase